MMYGLFFLISIVQAFWFVPIVNNGGMDVYLTTIGITVFSSGILAITGESLGILWTAGRTFGAKWRTGLALAICILTIGLGVLMGWNKAAEIRLLFQTDTGDNVFDYLALGDSIAILGLLMLGLLTRTSLRLLSLGITSVALFFAFSRTSFFLFLFSSIFVLFVGRKASQRIGILAVVTIAVFVAVDVLGESQMLQPAIEAE